jgi:arsenite/tail-anchored protein-transporting ATPase
MPLLIPPPQGVSGLKRMIEPGPALHERPWSATPFALPDRRGRDAFEDLGFYDPGGESCESVLGLVGGKGGVGKTTVTSLWAAHLAGRGARVEILAGEEDPVLRMIWGCAPEGEVASGVRILPSHPSRDFHDLISAVRGGLQELLPRSGERSGFRVRHDAEIIEQLPELAPPGFQQLGIWYRVAQRCEAREADVVLVDGVATGRFLSLLRLPGVGFGWLNELARLLMTAGGVAPSAPVLRQLLHWKGALHGLRKRLLTREGTAVLAVTRPEAVVRGETERLLSHLAEHWAPAERVIINDVVPPGSGCETCSRVSEEQQRILRQWSEKPMSAVRGVGMLWRWRTAPVGIPGMLSYLSERR